jgi:thiol:disulfide interchange protein DsbD
MSQSAKIYQRISTALIVAVLSATTIAQPRDFKVETNWSFKSDAVHSGDILLAALQVNFPSGFHVQSNKPLDESLIATVLTVTPPAGITVREVVYPKPIPFQVAGYDEPQPVFDQEFVIGIALQIGNDVQPGVHPVQAALGYQACNDKICLAPTTLELKAEIKVVPRDTAITPTRSPVVDRIAFSAEPTPPATQPIPTTTAAARPPPVDHDCDVVAELKNFTVLGATGGYLSADEFIAFVDDAEAGKVKKSVFADKGPIAIILLVIVGGILLNLTPCVLPLIPINLAIIGAGAQAGSRARGFALGGMYGLGMAAMYGALGLVVTLTSTAFGAINSTVWFNVAIAILFIFLAMAMFDVIAIDFTKYQSKIDATKMAGRGTFALAFFMGLVSALLAGACVAPVVIQVIVYAGDQYARGITIALALPFFLGLGMALPWPFAGAGLSLLPKPGMWMVRVKQVMGVFILLFAAY